MKWHEWIYKCLFTLIDDTLRREKNGKRRFSETKLTMFTAWMAVLYAFFYDLCVNGFRIESFGLMIGVATGMKVTDAFSKKLNRNNISE